MTIARPGAAAKRSRHIEPVTKVDGVGCGIAPSITTRVAARRGVGSQPGGTLGRRTRVRVRGMIFAVTLAVSEQR